MTAADASSPETRGKSHHPLCVRGNSAEKDNGIWNRLLQSCSILFDAIDVVELALRRCEEQIAGAVEIGTSLRDGGSQLPRRKRRSREASQILAFPSASTATKPTRLPSREIA